LNLHLLHVEILHYKSGLPFAHICIKRKIQVITKAKNNDWKTSIELSKKKDGSFTADVSLPKNSEHEFKYLINKTEWLSDPDADSQKPNSFGGSNSVVVI